MSDQMESAADAGNDPKTPQQPPSPPDPPAVKGNEDGEGGDDKYGGRKEKEYKQPKHWVEYTEGLAAIALVCITGYYAFYARQQWITMNNTYGEIQKQTYANCISAKLARSGILDEEQNSIAQHRLAVASIRQAEISALSSAPVIIVTHGPNGNEILDGNLRVPLVIRNTGNSTAVRLEGKVEIKIVKPGTEEKLDLTIHRGAFVHFFSPNLVKDGYWNWEAHYLKNGVPITAKNGEEALQIFGPPNIILAYGEVTFFYAFGLSEKVNFCIPLAAKVPLGYAIQCNQYNETETSDPLQAINEPEPAHPPTPIPDIGDCEPPPKTE